MKHKIYIVHEQVTFMGELRETIIRAFACKRTAKKFIDYKLGKLSALKAKYASTEVISFNTPSMDQIKLACENNNFKLEEVILYA